MSTSCFCQMCQQFYYRSNAETPFCSEQCSRDFWREDVEDDAPLVQGFLCSCTTPAGAPCLGCEPFALDGKDDER